VADDFQTDFQGDPDPIELPPRLLGPPKRPGDLGTVGPYRVVHLLGQGGMGYVFRGHDDALDRSVALKLMRPEWAANAAAKTRFLREGRAAAGLRSDHVVVVYGAGGDGPGETPYLAMEDLPGRTLDRWLEERGETADPATAVRVGRHALKGLAAAHAKGLTHRDIKPSNLWVEPAGRVKVLDFGIVHDVADPKVTATGQVLGSVAYMAKEQALGTAVDARADVYSLGVVMYQMLTGANPFNKGSYNTSLIAVYTEYPPPAADVVPGVPADLSEFVARLMSKERDQRPRDAAEALAELERVGRGMKPKGNAGAPIAQPTERTVIEATPTLVAASRRRQRKPNRVVAITVTAAAGVSAAILFAILGLGKPNGAGTAVIPSTRTTGQTLPTTRRPPDPLTQGTKLDTPAPTAKAETAAIPTAPPVSLTVRRGGEEQDFEVAPGVKMRFCWIPEGEVQLGSPKDEQDYVTKKFFDNKRPSWLDDENESTRGHFTTKGFWFAKYEVMQTEWVAVTRKANPSYFNGMNDNKAKGLPTTRLPVEDVSWLDAVEFCNRASERVGRSPRYKKVADDRWEGLESANGFRLPHENEWEYACRGGLGNRRPYYFGTALNGKQANCDGRYPYGTDATGEYKERTTASGEYAWVAPHPWGLCDIHGNVWEWCENSYEVSVHRPVLRGGSWYNNARLCRAADRGRDAPVFRYYPIGFRLCLSQE
jgi:formylglycine-generating enzyme required for sulfatase activity